MFTLEGYILSYIYALLHSMSACINTLFTVKSLPLVHEEVRYNCYKCPLKWSMRVSRVSLINQGKSSPLIPFVLQHKGIQEPQRNNPSTCWFQHQVHPETNVY